MGRTTDKTFSAGKPDMPRRKSGRAVFEQDGRSIWEWQTATGVFERDVSAEQVAKLEAADLSIVDDESSGTRIYDSSTTITRVNAARTSARAKTKTTDEAPSVLSRLLKRFVGRH